jgi:hypothetical protein
MRGIVFAFAFLSLQAAAAWGQTPHAGAIDTTDHQLDLSKGPQTQGPTIPERVAPVTVCRCSIVGGVKGARTVRAGCPAPATCDPYADYKAPKYGVTVQCTGGAALKTVIWDKTSDAKSTTGSITGGQNFFAARYRWCDEGGSNIIKGRADFCCQRSGNASEVKAPMCSKGRYAICAYVVFQCGGSMFSSVAECADVAAN